MKKKLSLFLVFCMVMGLMTPGVTAFDNNDNSVIITTGDYEVEPGEEFWVDFYVEDGKDLFAGFEFTLTTDESVAVFDRMYDDSKEKYVLVKEVGDIWSSNFIIEVNVEDSELIIAAGADSHPVSEDGIFFSVKMKAVGKSGDSFDLAFSDATAAGVVDDYVDIIPADYVDGSITVVEPDLIPDPEVCPDCGELEDECICEDPLCPDCGELLDECICEDVEICPYCGEEDCVCDYVIDLVYELFDEDGNLVTGVNEEYLDNLYNSVMEMEEGEERDALVSHIMVAYVQLGVHPYVEYDKAWEECADFVEARDAVYALFDEDWYLRDDATDNEINAAQELVDALEDGDAKDYLQALLDETKEIRYGYVLDDDDITVSDAITVLRHIVGLTNLKTDHPEGAFDRARVNGDYDVSVQDAILILRYVVGLIEVFPAEMVDKHPTTG